MLYVQPQKNKNADETTKCLEKIIKKLKSPPLYLCADRGGEFFNVKTKKMLKGYGIHLYATYNYDIKASIVERWFSTHFIILGPISPLWDMGEGAYITTLGGGRGRSMIQI